MPTVAGPVLLMNQGCDFQLSSGKQTLSDFGLLKTSHYEWEHQRDHCVSSSDICTANRTAEAVRKKLGEPCQGKQLSQPHPSMLVPSDFTVMSTDT